MRVKIRDVQFEPLDRKVWWARIKLNVEEYRSQLHLQRVFLLRRISGIPVSSETKMGDRIVSRGCKEGMLMSNICG